MMRIARQAENYGEPPDTVEEDLPDEEYLASLLQGARIGRLGVDPTV
jgi:hypothetical protein